MAKIAIVCEPVSIKMAKSFATDLEQHGDEVKLICNDKFPIADLMFGFFSLLSNKFDRTFIFISGEKDSILSTWISRELSIQRGLGQCFNIYPVFNRVEDIQPWWKKKDVVVFPSV